MQNSYRNKQLSKNNKSAFQIKKKTHTHSQRKKNKWVKKIINKIYMFIELYKYTGCLVPQLQLGRSKVHILLKNTNDVFKM